MYPTPYQESEETPLVDPKTARSNCRRKVLVVLLVCLTIWVVSTAVVITVLGIFRRRQTPENCLTLAITNLSNSADIGVQGSYIVAIGGLTSRICSTTKTINANKVSTLPHTNKPCSDPRSTNMHMRTHSG